MALPLPVFGNLVTSDLSTKVSSSASEHRPLPLGSAVTKPSSRSFSASGDFSAIGWKRSMKSNNSFDAAGPTSSPDEYTLGGFFGFASAAAGEAASPLSPLSLALDEPLFKAFADTRPGTMLGPLADASVYSLPTPPASSSFRIAPSVVPALISAFLMNKHHSSRSTMPPPLSSMLLNTAVASAFDFKSLNATNPNPPIPLYPFSISAKSMRRSSLASLPAPPPSTLANASNIAA
mmetsp:Transcript_10565/g.20978  ORF Transcript_10565/g.20978 Transcript_10565/m.20978 type:complete len:235 (+) Transcript_10565:291-995(+)